MNSQHHYNTIPVLSRRLCNLQMSLAKLKVNLCVRCIHREIVHHSTVLKIGVECIHCSQTTIINMKMSCKWSMNRKWSKSLKCRDRPHARLKWGGVRLHALLLGLSRMQRLSKLLMRVRAVTQAHWHDINRVNRTSFPAAKRNFCRVSLRCVACRYGCHARSEVTATNKEWSHLQQTSLSGKNYCSRAVCTWKSIKPRKICK
jgi:hypothetical protein